MVGWCGPHSCECGYGLCYGLRVKRNDARTELTTAQRGSLAGWGRMTRFVVHDSYGWLVLVAYKHRAHDLVTHDSTRDAAKRIGAHE